MFARLQNHPFAVEAFFESSLVLTFAASREQVQPLIPECLELDTFNDKWAFIAVAMVQTNGLRPKGFPKLLGNNFFLIGYRVFVRYINHKGRSLRGLYILRSETDKKRMEFFGNIFTHYHYTTTDIHQTRQETITEIISNRSAFRVKIDDSNEETICLPVASPFASWKEARRFAGPLPFTFTYDSSTREIMIIEGVRKNWKPMPVHVQDYRFAFMDNLKLNDVRLASAFIIRDIPYLWKKGKTEQWNKKEENFRVY